MSLQNHRRRQLTKDAPQLRHRTGTVGPRGSTPVSVAGAGIVTLPRASTAGSKLNCRFVPLHNVSRPGTQ